MATTKHPIGPFRKSVHPQEVQPPFNPAPDLKHETFELDGGKVIFEKDVAITMRDGVKLYADIYRPATSVAEKTPPLVFWSPFGKHGAVPRALFKNMGVDFEKLSPYTFFELPDPFLWCSQYHYSFVRVDPRGTWWSEGTEATFFSPQEGRDGYDVVEWAAQQPWSTGNVGWGAVSYYAMSAYQTAVLKPPHLKALLLWEAMSDIYREVNNVGGIPSVPFQHMWMNLTGQGLGMSEDHAAVSLEHPLFDEFWQSKVVHWTQINIPALSVTGWSSSPTHLRGTIEAWKALSTKDKWLLVHAGREWSEYYKDSGIEKQREFWDHFLKGKETSIRTWPTVQLDARTSADVSVRRDWKKFPPPAKLSNFYLASDGKLSTEPGNGQAEYTTFRAHDANSTLTFEYTFDKETEITGHASLTLHVQCLEFPDVDLFVALQKLGADGEEVKFWSSSQFVEAPAVLGWLRLSHRELDRQRSTPERPYHTHQKRQWVRPCDIVEAQIELWPSSTVWQAGETIRIAINGRGFLNPENKTQVRTPVHGWGDVRVWFGGKYASQLLAPVVEN
ncbi:hypothetical protein HRR83_003534 [Exophiala dermatitidis]|uniref:Xaa-Pro dipeptidyl-peptidase C-terminal domain-containing protein n=2 Tax=Exophiala dermatitidis TaxID=5970 RepID=H6BSC0_EXODN|nr:uncharacterized protein HMPREF1120_01520 [Exophiala dermatitidis NIH/UT8656]KAJ4543004.1 hypothetical protein HRR77_005266 [Exophiala dermatitidis]EHY53326.1 hypothetical protein HMPREF1120_01520 [Exophiala dermatitidis NIH/UT8656]KAJ4543505.1 hypothetical protein HRR76_001574 [Exophiala dermatitidis]KAJ4574969.1 hypothetical protein HRR79_001904 [Exophiala dermatitidis]KAJ4598786.1 hypothetical protein HRR83_003534 [Exophiala dermatitidis]